MPPRKKKKPGERSVKKASGIAPVGQRGADAAARATIKSGTPQERLDRLNNQPDLIPNSDKARLLLNEKGEFKASPQAKARQAAQDPRFAQVQAILNQEPETFTAETARRFFGIEIDPSLNFDALDAVQKQEVIASITGKLGAAIGAGIGFGAAGPVGSAVGGTAGFGVGQAVAPQLAEGIPVNIGPPGFGAPRLKAGSIKFDKFIPQTFYIDQVGENKKAVVGAATQQVEGVENLAEAIRVDINNGFVDEAIDGIATLKNNLSAADAILYQESLTAVDQQLADIRGQRQRLADIRDIKLAGLERDAQQRFLQSKGTNLQAAREVGVAP